jgi:hypothetical protein
VLIKQIGFKLFFNDTITEGNRHPKNYNFRILYLFFYSHSFAKQLLTVLGVTPTNCAAAAIESKIFDSFVKVSINWILIRLFLLPFKACEI